MDKILISNSIFIKSFTARIIKTIINRKINKIKREIINSDLIPEFSSEIINTRLGKNRIMPDLENIPQPSPDLSSVPLPPQMLMAHLSFPLPKDHISATSSEYGKLSQLLKEDSITSIECNGANKDLTITRSGEKQLTKISLTKIEINEFLKIISEKSRIPLIDGVFKAQIDKFEVNAVISDIIDTRFIIRKQTPYNLIDKKNVLEMIPTNNE